MISFKFIYESYKVNKTSGHSILFPLDVAGSSAHDHRHHKNMLAFWLYLIPIERAWYTTVYRKKGRAIMQYDSLDKAFVMSYYTTLYASSASLVLF